MTNKLMIRLSEGLASWLGYQQATKKSSLYCEYITYIPIFEIAASRGWRVYPQKAIPKPESSRGPRQTIDFLFVWKPDPRTTDRKNTPALAALEIKFLRQKKIFTGNFTKDVKKLISVDENTFELSDYGPLRRYIMIVGQGNTAFVDGKSSREDNRLTEQIGRICDPEADKHDIGSGWLRFGPGDRSWRFKVLTLQEQNWWKSTSPTGEETETSVSLAEEIAEAASAESDEYSEQEVEKVR